LTDLLERRLIFVTGKGGVGKTSVASALALLASEMGKRTLLCEVEPKGDVAASFDEGPTAFRAREFLPGLNAMSMDTEASLREYLKLHLRVPVVGRIGPLARAFDFVATAAPGVKEILTVGKLCYEVRESHYDLVVVDAAPTGHIVGQLAAPEGINELVKVGMIRHQTGWMLDILSEPSLTGLCIVTTPEEMPVSEAIDLKGRIERETSVDLACVVVNRVLPELFGRGEQKVFDALTEEPNESALAKACGHPQEAVSDVIESARLAVTIRRSAVVHIERLREAMPARVPIVLLPYLFARGHGLRAIRQLSSALADELVS
jgi:anion-transporting  ArsA/GET3 family ATPase